jgi:DNA-binding transcriptional MerR regulator
LNGRSHLSIGEVLSLLQDEFPDVTISKIRFLESQGLVDPERTPSGYRKFYEADIDRLRWVLRQQRDAFLPLKVIKGRLDQQGEDAPEDDEYVAGSTTPSPGYDESAPDEDGMAAGSDEGLGSISASAGASASGRATSANAVGTRASGARDRGTTTGAHFSGAQISGAQISGAQISGDSGASDDRPGEYGPSRDRPSQDRPSQDRPSQDRPAQDRAAQDRTGELMGQLFDTGPPYLENGEPETNETLGQGSGDAPYEPGRPVQAVADAAPTLSHSSAAEGANHRQPAGDAMRPDEPNGPDEPDGQTSSRRRLPTPPPDRVERGTRTGRTEPRRDVRDMMTVPDEDELALEDVVQEGGGVDIETVRDLERYGLITPRIIGGASYYTRDAAVIIQLASAFARHGVEARHLRAYKGAADREAGLVQQVIMPLIRQRNPEARQAAMETVEELSQLGGELRAALLRSALADLH